MLKKLLPLIFIGVLIFGLAGCGNSGGGTTGPTQAEQAVVQQKIEEFKGQFQTAVASFSTDGMLTNFEKCGDGSNEVLTITEAGYTYHKDYKTLQSELVDVTTDQLKWKDAYQYMLTLEFVSNTLSYTIDSSIHGIGQQQFRVIESAPGAGYNDPLQTDSGTIIVEVTNVLGKWVITHMTISYDPAKSLQNSSNKVSGFGFGTFNL